jgi:xylulokinase
VEYFLKNIIYTEDEFETGPAPDDAYRRFNTIAANVPAGSGGVLFFPWLNGTVVPQEDPHVRGGFVNLSLTTDRRHLTRAIMEGLAYNNRWTREAAEKFIGRPISHFRFSGGGALSEVLSQIHADVLGVPIHQIDDPLNTTVRGTALLALITLGYRAIDEIPDLIRIKQIFEPHESNRGLYDRMYTQYRAFFKRNRKIFAALNAGA